MRISLKKETGRWRLSEMEKTHVEFLRLAAEDASMTDCPGGRERLLQPPLRGVEAEADPEFIKDWDEFVTPELEMKFAGDVGVFMSDLDSIKKMRRREPADSQTYRLDVPLDHAGAWFSTLNQARLLLDLKHKLHEPEDAPEENVIQETFAPDAPGRFLAMMRYEMFAWIQEWLVRNVM